MSDKYIDKENKYSAHIYSPIPAILHKGKGCYLYDINNKKYIDMMSAYSAASHGHCHPKLVKELKKQATKLAITSRAFHTDKLSEFLEKICKISNFDKAIPMNTGAEAVETAIKAARQWGYKMKNIPKNKAEIIVCSNNFHGRTTTIISFSSEEEYKDNFGPHTPGFKIIPFDNIQALKKALTKNVCAFLVEPIQGEAGIIMPHNGYLQECQKICKKNNILFILDEIQTGIGRTGKLFAHSHEIEKPDGLILGKALGGGILPISCFLGDNKIMNLFKSGSHGSTFGGNPLACAVSIKALELLQKEKLIQNSAKMGKYFLNQLQKIKHPIIKEIRGKGLLIAVELNEKIANSYNINARKICEELKENGILTKDTHNKVIRLAPPLIINKKIIDKTVTTIKNIIDKY